MKSSKKKEKEILYFRHIFFFLRILLIFTYYFENCSNTLELNSSSKSTQDNAFAFTHGCDVELWILEPKVYKL